MDDRVTGSSDLGGELGAFYGAPPSGIADDAYLCGSQVPVGVQVDYPGEEVEEGAGMGVAR